MKLITLLTTGLCAAVPPCAFAADCDKPTFDLAAISKARYDKVDPTNPELVKDGAAFKRTTAMVYDGKIDVLCTDAKVAAAMSAEREEGLFAMLSPEELIGLKDIRAEWLHNFAVMKVTLPDDKGGSYKVRFRYRANHPREGYGNAHYSAYMIIDDQDGHTLARQNIPDSGEDSDYWFSREKQFDVPAGVVELQLKLRLDGVGYLKVAGVSLKRAIAEAEPDVRFLVKPNGWIDDRFAVESGKVGVLDVCWRSRKGFDVQWWKSDVEFVVPKGFEYVGCSLKEKGRFRREKLADGSELIVLPMMDRTQPIHGGFHDNFGIGLMVRATGAVGTEGKLTFRALRNKEQLGEGGAITLFAVEPFTAVQPKRYRIGAMLTYNFQNFRGKAAASEAYADYLREKGVTWIMPNTPWLVEDRSLVPMWRKKGFDLITPTDHDYLMNAYKICGTGERPEADKFVPRPGLGKSWDFPKSTCPAAVYEERPYFVTNCIPNLASRSAGTDGQWVNWEPFYFRGCYCEYCKKRGTEWMEKTGDANIEHFHSYQHGMLAKTIHRWMLKTFNSTTHHSSLITRHSDVVGLMPAIAWCEVGSYGRTHDYPQDKLSKDYIGEFKWIPAWGPYVGWSADEGPYNGINGKLSAYFFVAKDVREELDRNYPDPDRRPKLMGQPAGPNWVLQPEWLEISMDAYFFNRWEAIAPWIFPQGADARHWKAFANAVNRAAKYEDVVLDGSRNDAATTLTYKPGTEAICAFPDKSFLPEIRNVPLIQQTTYDYQGSRYVAVFNLNDVKGAVFTLKTAGLSVGNYTIVDEDGRALFNGKTFSAETLAKDGIELALPLSACRVFRIRP